MCVFSILEAKTCVADGYSKPKMAVPEPQAEPMAATWPASPVAAPAPTVEVKEEAKPEDTELRSLIRVKAIFWEKNRLELSRRQGIQVYKHLFFLFLNNSLSKKRMKFYEARILGQTRTTREIDSVQVGIGWIISLCQLETFQEAGVDVRDMTRCCFMNPELDAALKETQEQVSEVGNIFQDAIRHFLGKWKMLEEESAWL